jgi:2-dehydropantoate 2-reductase
LCEAGRHEVTACVRTPRERLIVERIDDVIDVPIRALTDPADAEPVDWVLLATKAHHMLSAAPWLAQLCAPHTRVAALQNGIHHEARLAPFIDGARVVPTIVYYNGERLAPERVRFRRAGTHDLAVRDDADGRAFAELLEGTGLRVLRSDDFATLAWRKLLINAVANPVTALTLQRQSVFRRADVQELCLAVLEESATVGRADGARLDADEAAQIMATLLTYPPEVGTSMYFDRLAGRPFEVEALTGAVVAAAERYGIPTPLNRALLTLLRATSDGLQSS